MWYAKPMRVNTEALARAKSIIAEAVRQCQESGTIESLVDEYNAQEPTPVKNWDVSCPWCMSIALLKVRGRTKNGMFEGFFRCDSCNQGSSIDGDAVSMDAYKDAFMSVVRERAYKQTMRAQNPDPLDTLRAITQPSKAPKKSLSEAFQSASAAALARAYEEPGAHTLPLSEELRAEVHQFYQESMTHARESGSLPYALSHAP